MDVRVQEMYGKLHQIADDISLLNLEKEYLIGVLKDKDMRKELSENDTFRDKIRREKKASELTDKK